MPTNDMTSSIWQAPTAASPRTCSTVNQGLRFVHFSAQRKHFMWARGWFQGLLRGCIAGVSGH